MTEHPTGDSGTLPASPLLPYESAPVSGPPASRVESDTPCRRCGYNLRGLSFDGQCPECATRVAQSVAGPLLCYADPNWVSRLARGAKLILEGYFLALILAIVGASVHAMPFVACAAIAGALIASYGCWLLTTPDPSTIGEDQYGRSRSFSRTTIVFAAVAIIMIACGSMSALPASIHSTMLIGANLALIASYASQVILLHYLSKLARRIPDNALTKSANHLAYFYGTSLGAFIVCVVILRWTNARATNVVNSALVALAITGISSLIAGIKYISLLYEFSNVLKNQAKLARLMWSTVPPFAPDPSPISS